MADTESYESTAHERAVKGAGVYADEPQYTNIPGEVYELEVHKDGKVEAYFTPRNKVNDRGEGDNQSNQVS